MFVIRRAFPARFGLDRSQFFSKDRAWRGNRVRLPWTDGAISPNCSTRIHENSLAVSAVSSVCSRYRPYTTLLAVPRLGTSLSQPISSFPSLSIPPLGTRLGGLASTEIMSTKPIFMATHPRACSTAFERVFMTRRDDLQTIHEPFGDAFYYGPERMGGRYEGDEQAREQSGFADSSFKSILDRIAQEGDEGKRVFIKDIIHYIVPPNKQEPRIAPSLNTLKRGVGTTGHTSDVDGEADLPPATPHDSGAIMPSQSASKSSPFPYEGCVCETTNPTVVPAKILEQFHFTFLIRHPRNSIPSYYRCCIPPLLDRTKFETFMPCEAGYTELRRFFDYCKDTGLIGPSICGQKGADPVAPPGSVQICVVDADDLLDDPEAILRSYCDSIGFPFTRDMLEWKSDESHEFAKKQFSKWDGFHDDAINSKDLKPRIHKHAPKSDEEMYADWVKKYGQEAADLIKQTVADNLADYEYLKQYAIRV
nr:branched-chain-amino-acid aminotransferase-like protein 1 [Quercus suber]